MAIAYIVDEDEEAALFLHSQLIDIGYFEQVKRIADSESFSTSLVNEPAIVFVNFDMPLMKGALLYLTLIQNNIPFVCMTKTRDAYKVAFGLDAFDCLFLPYRTSRLLETVQKYSLYQKSLSVTLSGR